MLCFLGQRKKYRKCEQEQLEEVKISEVLIGMKKILLLVLTTIGAEVISSCNFLVAVSENCRNNDGNVCQN